MDRMTEQFHRQWGWDPPSNNPSHLDGPWIRDIDRIVAQLAIVTAPWYVRLWWRIRRFARSVFRS